MDSQQNSYYNPHPLLPNQDSRVSTEPEDPPHLRGGILPAYTTQTSNPNNVRNIIGVHIDDPFGHDGATTGEKGGFLATRCAKLPSGLRPHAAAFVVALVLLRLAQIGAAFAAGMYWASVGRDIGQLRGGLAGESVRAQKVPTTVTASDVGDGRGDKRNNLIAVGPLLSGRGSLDAATTGVALAGRQLKTTTSPLHTAQTIINVPKEHEDDPSSTFAILSGSSTVFFVGGTSSTSILGVVIDGDEESSSKDEIVIPTPTPFLTTHSSFSSSSSSSLTSSSSTSSPPNSAIATEPATNPATTTSIATARILPDLVSSETEVPEPFSYLPTRFVPAGFLFLGASLAFVMLILHLGLGFAPWWVVWNACPDLLGAAFWSLYVVSLHRAAESLAPVGLSRMQQQSPSSLSARETATTAPANGDAPFAVRPAIFMSALTATAFVAFFFTLAVPVDLMYLAAFFVDKKKKGRRRGGSAGSVGGGGFFATNTRTGLGSGKQPAAAERTKTPSSAATSTGNPGLLGIVPASTSGFSHQQQQQLPQVQQPAQQKTRHLLVGASVPGIMPSASRRPDAAGAGSSFP